MKPSARGAETLAADKRAAITQSGASWRPWAEAFAQGVADWFRAAGFDPDAPGARASIEINSTRIPQRVEDVLRVLSEGAGLESVGGLELLDIGCGYGPLTVYLATVLGARQAIGSDIREDYLDVGRRALAKLGVDDQRVRFERADMVALPYPDASRDLILVHNAFCYMTNWPRAQQALREFFRVLRPGGVLLVYQPNLWCPFEAFTRLPFVHWLPRRATERLIVWSGRRNTYSDIQLWGPAQMVRLGRAAGFTRLRCLSLWRLRLLSTGVRRFFTPYHYTTAVKP